MDFDAGAADGLIAACEDAADTLANQAGPRESVTSQALDEFRGVFADCFRENVFMERAARSSLIQALDEVARQVRDAKTRAETERRRLDRVAVWEAEARSQARFGTPVLNLAPSLVETPRPVVSADTPRQGLRAWVGGNTAGASSADPDALESAAAVYRIQDDRGQSVVDRTTVAVNTFTQACSWALVDLDALTGGLRRYLADNREDTARLGGVAAAFRTAGGSGHVGAVTLSNDTLVLATHPAGLSGPALLAFLATATPTDLKTLATLPGWQHTLQGIDPGKIAAWWAGMNREPLWAADGTMNLAPAQTGLLTAAPALFGNLNGIPYTARSTANVLWLGQQLADAKKQLAADQERLSAAPQVGDLGVFTVDALTSRITALESIQKSLGGAVPGAPRFLIGLTADVPPLAQIAIGNLDRATNVTYAVPGMNTSTMNTNGWVIPSQNLYDEQRGRTNDPAGSTRFAVVAWIGYKTPPIPFTDGQPNLGVIQGDDAKAGAVRLGHDLAGFNGTRPGATLNIAAHSYGTTTAADALAAADYHVTNTVFLGSAGVEPAIPNAGALHSDHVYAAQAPDSFPWQKGDGWAWQGRVGSFRNDPTRPDLFPGTTVFGADGEPNQPDLHATTTHDPTNNTPGNYGYFDRDTESLRNTALATTGQGAKVTPDQSRDQNLITGGIG